MTKHLVFIAVEVDTKYSANEVASEINYFLPFITSECLDTIHATPARIKQQVKTFTVWTANKADGCTTYDELMAYEEKTGYGYSSQVTTDDIEAIVDAVNNELDGELLYHLEDAS